VVIIFYFVYSFYFFQINFKEKILQSQHSIDQNSGYIEYTTNTIAKYWIFFCFRELLSNLFWIQLEAMKSGPVYDSIQVL